jgi:hypothetical protein
MGTIPCYLLGQDITIEPYMGEGAYGPTFGAPVTIRARVEGRRRVVRRADGETVTSTATAIVGPDDTVAVESRATYSGQTYEVAEVVDQLAQRRVHHRELVLADIKAGAT